jgi:hypothetical protein
VVERVDLYAPRAQRLRELTVRLDRDLVARMGRRRSVGVP